MGISILPDNARRRVIPDSGITMPSSKLAFNREEISFADSSCTGCVGVIDLVNSTCTTASLCREKMVKYYGLFLNTTTAIVRSYGGIVVKNVGDGILYYFPFIEPGDISKELAKWLESSWTLVQFHRDINLKFSMEGLPRIDYRVSLDYGDITLAKSENSLCEDIFGTTVNISAKINRMADRNRVAIGGDLYELSKNFTDYKFRLLGSYNIGFRTEYPVYSLERRTNYS